MKTFLHSGSLGDVIYSLPTIKALGGGILYLKSRNLFSPYSLLFQELKALLIQQPFIHAVRMYPDVTMSAQYPLFEYHPSIQIDYDLDLARRQLFRSKIHIIKRHMDAFDIRKPWNRPWLKVNGDNKLKGAYTLIHVTPRWREGSRVNWYNVFHSITGPVYFIGYPAEWQDFCDRYKVNMELLLTDNILDMAILIRDCKALYGNQSVSTTIAQGLGKTYFLERNPKSDNVLMYTPNEILL